MYPEIDKLLRSILGTECPGARYRHRERSISQLRRIKTYQHSTMGGDRFSNLAEVAFTVCSVTCLTLTLSCLLFLYF